jgi:hypothetical protein
MSHRNNSASRIKYFSHVAFLSAGQIPVASAALAPVS